MRDIVDVREVRDVGSRAAVVGVTLHMFGVPGIVDAAGIREFYRTHPEYTGGKMPYTFVINPHGRIEQALGIYDVGPHALRWSSNTIGIVNIGDFNKHRPTQDQWVSTIDLTSEILLALGFGVTRTTLAGHTERPNSTKSKYKNCPGKLWDMNSFRDAVIEAQRERAIQRLSEAVRVAD